VNKGKGTTAKPGRASWLILNQTDGVIASPQRYMTEAQASEAKDGLKARFVLLGGDLTAGGKKIAPEKVLLKVQRIKYLEPGYGSNSKAPGAWGVVSAASMPRKKVKAVPFS